MLQPHLETVSWLRCDVATDHQQRRQQESGQECAGDQNRLKDEHRRWGSECRGDAWEATLVIPLNASVSDSRKDRPLCSSPERELISRIRDKGHFQLLSSC